MCVLKELYKPAIGYYETYVNNVVLHNLLQKNSIRQSLYLRKRQEPIIKTIIFIQKAMKPQLSAIRDDKDIVKYDAILDKDVNKLKKMAWKYRFSFSENKKEEILERQREICVDIISHSFLWYKFDGNEIIKRKNELKRPTFFLENYFKSVNNGLRYFQTLVENGAREDEYIKKEIKPLLDLHTDGFLKIESYSEKLKECKPYEGFDIYSTGKWKVTILSNGDKENISYELPILCLQRKKSNSFYPYVFMVVCIDFEMESGGASEDEAYINLKNSFDLLFKSMLENSDDTSSIILEIDGEIARKTIWKDTFNELFRIGRHQNVKIRNEDFQYYGVAK